MGSFGFSPGEPHDVVINPNGSATIYGAYNATVHSLNITGNRDQLVTFNLNNGSTATTDWTTGTTLNNATLTGSGRLEGGLNVWDGSRVNVDKGQVMQLTGGNVYNNGTIRVLGTAADTATLEATSSVENGSNGKINLQNANVSFLNGLSNYGQLNVTSGISNVAGYIFNNVGGKIILSGTNDTTFWDTVDVEAGSELRVSAGSKAVFFGEVFQRTDSIFSGSGNKFYEGGLSVGNSPGLGVDAGNVSFGAGNTYLAEIGGLNAGTEFDKYQVAGKLSFGGTLKLMWWSNFSAQAGNAFDLFDWGSSEGTFSTIDTSGAQLANGLNWDFSKLYINGEISVAAVPVPEAVWLFGSGLGLLALKIRRKNNLVS